MDIADLRARCHRSLSDAAFIEDKPQAIKCDPQTILALADEVERLRAALAGFVDQLDSEDMGEMAVGGKGWIEQWTDLHEAGRRALHGDKQP